MSLSEIDGFLASLAAGPGPIPPPEEWMPAIWDEGEPAFSDPDEALRTIDAIMSRLVEVCRQLREDPDAYRPVFQVGDDDAEIAADWARGFLDGVTLRAEAWEPLRRTPEVWEKVVFITMHITDKDERILAGRRSEGLAELRRQARRTIPSAVASLCRFWRARDGVGEAAVKVGRDGPCPPGSGRERKRWRGVARGAALRASPRPRR